MWASNSRSFAFTTRGCSLEWSLFTPHAYAAPPVKIEPLDDEASESQQDDALRRLHAAMRESLTVARANHFVEQLLPETEDEHSPEQIPSRFARKTSRT